MENYMFCAILVKTVLQDETLKGEELGVQDEKSKFFRNTAFIACCKHRCTQNNMKWHIKRIACNNVHIRIH